MAVTELELELGAMREVYNAGKEDFYRTGQDKSWAEFLSENAGGKITPEDVREALESTRSFTWMTYWTTEFNRRAKEREEGKTVIAEFSPYLYTVEYLEGSKWETHTKRGVEENAIHDAKNFTQRYKVRTRVVREEL